MVKYKKQYRYYKDVNKKFKIIQNLIINKK